MPLIAAPLSPETPLAHAHPARRTVPSGFAALLAPESAPVLASKSPPPDVAPSQPAAAAPAGHGGQEGPAHGRPSTAAAVSQDDASARDDPKDAAPSATAIAVQPPVVPALPVLPAADGGAKPAQDEVVAGLPAEAGVMDDDASLASSPPAPQTATAHDGGRRGPTGPEPPAKVAHAAAADRQAPDQVGSLAAPASLPAAGAASVPPAPAAGDAVAVAAKPDVIATADQAASAAPAGAPPVAPGVQLAQAVTALHLAPDGSSRLTVRLDPAELGQVQVQISRTRGGEASVSVAVERPETLRALQADLTHLHLALDRAGLPEQRALVLHLTPPADQPAATAGSGGSGSAPGGQGGQQQGSPGGSRQPPGPASAWTAQPDVAGASAMPPGRAVRLQTGINLTA